MTVATTRVALVAIRELMIKGSAELAVDLLNELIESLDQEPEPAPAVSQKSIAKRPLTGAERTALYRARKSGKPPPPPPEVGPEVGPNVTADVTKNVTKSDGERHSGVTNTSLSSSSQIGSTEEQEHAGSKQDPDLSSPGSADQNSKEGAKFELKLGSDVTARDARVTAAVTRDVTAVFEHWVTVMGRDPSRTKLTAQRRSRIRARLAEGYSVADLKAAVDGCKLSAFHMGENPAGQAYNDLEQILRSGGHVEGHRNRVDGGPGRRTSMSPAPGAKQASPPAYHQPFPRLEDSP